MSYHQSVPPTEDRISSLPDSILSHILSFLPTKLASTTTILSKRWNSLWLSSLTLTLDTQSFKDFPTFRLFVYSLFMSRDYNLPIQSFHLTCRITPDCDPQVLNRIVSAAVQQGGIQNISLCNEHIDLVTSNKLLKLVPCIFSILSCTRTTLVVLKLMTFRILDIPPIVDLPLLKTLHLDGIWFTSDYMFHRLLFGCPNLEDLHLSNLLIRKGPESEEGKYKHLPKLVTANLSIIGIGYICFPFDWVHNAKFLRVYMNSKQLGTMTVKSSCTVDKNAKLQMLVKLSMCSRGSGTCKLLFD